MTEQATLGTCNWCGDRATHVSTSSTAPDGDAVYVCEDHADPRHNVGRTVARVRAIVTHTVTDHYGDAHNMPGPFRTVDQVKRANENAGNHFFSREAMRSFGSRVAPDVIGGRVIITSEQDRAPYSDPEYRAWSGQRRYTARLVADDGTLKPIGPEDREEFGAFETLRQARAWARKYAAGEVPSSLASWIKERREGETS